MKNKMYTYLLNHNYISFNKTSDKQQELSVERAECIVNKCDNLLNERQQKIDRAIEFIKENTLEESNGCGYKWEMIYNDYLSNNIDQLLEILKGDNND